METWQDDGNNGDYPGDDDKSQGDSDNSQNNRRGSGR